MHPILLKFTVVSRIDIKNCNKRSITLICHDTIICKYIYCRVLIFYCECLEKISSVQCGSCQLTEPYLSLVISPERKVNILYSTQYPCILEPGIDIFVGLVNPSYKQFCRFMTKKQINSISVEALGFILEGDNLFFYQGHISNKEDSINEYKSIHFDGFLKESKFMKYVDYNMSNVCQICANKGEKYLCNLNNLDCKSLDQFRKQSGIERPGFKCEFLNCKPQNIKYCSMVLPVFLSEKGFSNVLCEIFPHLQGLIKKNICNEP